ncbi:soluble cytochrome b562 [Vibrio xiamenensis]|uniref:Soluble cytochrome b562 n=1 Tax=Vibrio xiamenensis TaxID=861298 RepID=A0A1G8AAC6_9VIBR|nr:cytochrome b562 [Vibrio xiamenensis]SDH17888.1 soluble cytochrome b562 [Vibrio xiamenensis]
MKKVLLSALILVSASQAWATGIDLKATMKQMRLEFKQAASASSVDEMRVPIAKLDDLVEQAKQGVYPPEKQDIYLEGFNKLSVAIDDVENHLDAGDLEQAKQSLRTVDELREEYHDKRNPSIWSKLFG